MKLDLFNAVVMQLYIHPLCSLTKTNYIKYGNYLSQYITAYMILAVWRLSKGTCIWSGFILVAG